MATPRSVPIFLIFLLSNTALAYGEFPILVDLWIGTLGLLLPFLFLCLSGPEPSDLPLPGASKSASKERTVLWVLLAAGFAVRFLYLSDFLVTPLYDELVNAYYAIHLVDHWVWNPFFNWSQLPPLHIWSLALLFKAFGFSPWTLWLPPALFSFIALLFFQGGIRALRFGSFSLWVTFLVAVDFWPCFLGRFSHQVNSMMLMESLVFYCFAKYLAAKKKGDRRLWSCLLGLGLGLGFTTYFAWPLVAATAGLTFFFLTLRKDRGDLIWAIGSSMLPLVPLALAAILTGYGNYIATLLVSHSNPDNDIPWSFDQDLLYVTTFFWQGLKRHFAYNPWWGGFLNPVLGSFFFIGLGLLARNARKAWAGWVLAALGLMFFPILLANNTNWFHVAPLMPLFLFVTALGIQKTWSAASLDGKKPLLGVLLAASCFLDLTNLGVTRAYLNENLEPPQFLRTFGILQAQADHKGPGKIFTHFYGKGNEITLWTLSAPFNGLFHPEGPGQQARWAAFLVTRRDRDVLERKWTGIRWICIRKSNSPYSDPFLGLLSLENGEPRAMGTFTEAEKEIEKVVFLDLNRPTDRRRDDLLRRVTAEKGLYGYDPVLASWYWRFLEVLYTENHDLSNALRARVEYFKTLKDPTAMEHYQLGMLLLKNRYYGPALEHFLQAGRLEKDFALPKDKEDLLRALAQR